MPTDPASTTLRRHLLLAALLGLGLGLGCTSSPDEGCDFIDVHLTATQNPDLAFSWSPAKCGAYQLVVTEGTPIRWLTETFDLSNSLHPPIRYGVHPAGASGPTPATLTPGFHYIAVLWRGDVNRTSSFVDTVTFVYSPPD